MNKEFRPLAPNIWPTWNVGQVRTALYSHEAGDFSYSSQLATAMRRDDRIFATLDTRVLGLLGLPFSVRASEWTTNKEDAERYAKRVAEWWQRQDQEAAVAEALRWRLLMGFAIGELVWKPFGPSTAHELVPELHIHDPQFVSWREEEQSFYLTTRAGLQKITPGDGRWVLFAAPGETRPWMNGLIRSLAIPFLMRTYARRDWARRSEIEGVGIRKAKVPKGATDEKLIRRFLENVKALGSETTLKLPEGFDLELVVPAATAADGFQKLLAHCDMAITLAILGQNLTTQAEGGSYAAAAVHARTQLDRHEADIKGLTATLRNQIVIPWGRINIPQFDEDAAPLVQWDPMPPGDHQARAQALLTLSQAVNGLSRFVDVKPLLVGFGLEPLENPR